MHSPLTLRYYYSWYLCTCIHYPGLAGLVRYSWYSWYPFQGCQVPRLPHPTLPRYTPNERYLVHLSIIQFYSLLHLFKFPSTFIQGQLATDSSRPLPALSFFHPFVYSISQTLSFIIVLRVLRSVPRSSFIGSRSLRLPFIQQVASHLRLWCNLNDL